MGFLVVDEGLKPQIVGDISLSACMIFAIRSQQSENRSGEEDNWNNMKLD